MTDTQTAFTEWVGRQKPGRTPEAQDALDDAVDALEDILEGRMRAGDTRVADTIATATAVNELFWEDES